jgi:hypothetical protein
MTTKGDTIVKLKKLPAVIRINAKCSDLFGAQFVDEAGNNVADYDGYVPDFMPGQHWGDYVEIDVDLKTGKILNWEPPSLEAVNKALENA